MVTTESILNKPPNMTRGSAYVLYEKDGETWIGYADEFNGNMYPGGYYEDMINTLIHVKTYEDFGLAMYEFNKEHFGYDHFKTFHCTLKDYIQSDNNKQIDFNIDYYKYWFSDYLFFINFTGKMFSFVVRTKEEKKVTCPSDTVMAFNFGDLTGVYVTGIPTDGIRYIT